VKIVGLGSQVFSGHHPNHLSLLEDDLVDEISLDELNELYLDTVARCTSELLHRSDEEIEYELFEEFDVGVHSFLHDDSLARLRHASYIDDEMLAISKEVRGRWLALQKTSWTLDEIRTKKEWQELFALCSRLDAKGRHR
jgi:hypothetical protein